MEPLHSPFLIISLVIILALAVCGGDESHGEITYEEGDDEDDEVPLTADGCYEDEVYVPGTQSCMLDIACEDEAESDLILAELYNEEGVASIEFYAMSEDECLPGEGYDLHEQVCYIECDTDEECNELAAEIY